ncbi:putative baseplate assembly protein [Pseudanabaena sp. ABRG5-3]|uniref:putative baseplate assembly protein n=1 Tax=Pseudanabaena sp. ABRG5-3 TaxID=685565 RepID=UPI000DC7086B|nr:putative baseplate assembly protein [Pseudanabaena sp. ABRG5-3]BBC26977.1 baseplate J family protein [Pseudanabaena sp. ABRG5-3]
MTREFDFLPNLPKSDLDDRTFAELVNECLLRIPRYCPEWTNYNPSDPGVTLIELFAWLTDQMLMRFNQVPRRNYVAFLELLGIRLQAPAPSQTEVTFYLSASLPEAYTIPAGSEVATLRTEDEEAIIFSTDHPLVIAKPRIAHLLAAPTTQEKPEYLRDLLQDVWTEDPEQEWSGQEIALFSDPPQPNNCFYVVFDENQPIDGNVIALKFKGESATTTGINPNNPPRYWEAWDGYVWQPVLLKDSDDRTKGFSFSELANEGINPLQGAEIIFHVPLTWNVSQFSTYRGRWLRCSYVELTGNQAGYSRSPHIIGMSARAIGGTVTVTQCHAITNEVVGESNGKAGQVFYLLNKPVLPRKEDEYLLITPPVGLPQIWHEVENFSESGANDLHYVIDSTSGMIQFGPFVQAPNYQSQHTLQRMRLQGEPMQRVLPDGMSKIAINSDSNQNLNSRSSGNQYGAIPPKGSVIQMVKYRTGGGFRGNVQKGSIQIAKNAIPYVASLTNHLSACNGADAESLDDVAIRVPKMLKTRDRAVNQSDFEYLTLIAGEGAVARVLCTPAKRREDAGIVKLLIVPRVRTEGIDQGQGIAPEQFVLTPQLSDRILNYLDERKMLGVQIQLEPPKYVGVCVQTEIALEATYSNPLVQQDIVRNLKVMLYRFLNPINGGVQGQGWEFGRPVYPSDIVKLLQNVQGVRFLGTVQLFELRYENGEWVRRLSPQPIIDPSPTGLICSWRSPRFRSSHVINIV